MFAARAYMNFLVFSPRITVSFFGLGATTREIFWLDLLFSLKIFFDFDSLSSVVGAGDGKENTEERNEFFHTRHPKK